MSFRDLSLRDPIDSNCRHETPPVFHSPYLYPFLFHHYFHANREAAASVPSGRHATVDLIVVCFELRQRSTGAQRDPSDRAEKYWIDRSDRDHDEGSGERIQRIQCKPALECGGWAERFAERDLHPDRIGLERRMGGLQQ
jgi:hypothetical protein